MFHRHKQNPTVLMRLGFVCLILASGVRALLPTSHPLSPDLRDGALGLLIGLAIGMLLVSVVLRRRQGPNGGGRA